MNDDLQFKVNIKIAQGIYPNIGSLFVSKNSRAQKIFGEGMILLNYEALYSQCVIGEYEIIAVFLSNIGVTKCKPAYFTEFFHIMDSRH